MNHAKRSTLSIAAVLTFAMLSGTAYSATISLTPLNQTVMVGDVVNVTLNMNFTAQSTLGGGVDVFYNSTLLDYISFSYDTALGDDLNFRRTPDDLTNEVNGISFGSFDGLTGLKTIGVLSFNAIGSGGAQLTLGDNDSPAGGFVDVNGAPIQMTYGGASVNIQPIPIPAALWLFASGFGWLTLGAWRRQK